MDGLGQSSPRSAEVLAIASGKGGVGTSTLALNLALNLSLRGGRVVLVDAAYGLGNIDALIPPGRLLDESILPASRDARGPEPLLVEGPVGLPILAGVTCATANGRLVELSPRRWAELLTALKTAYDVVLVDCGGGGVTRNVLTLAGNADRILLMTSPDQTAVARTYAAMKVLSARGADRPVGLVVNFAKDAATGQRIAGRCQQACAEFLGRTVTPWGVVLYDWHVSRAARHRKPVCLESPRCPASLCLERVCDVAWPASASSGEATDVWSRAAGLFL